jgi:hypothetical protein
MQSVKNLTVADWTNRVTNELANWSLLYQTPDYVTKNPSAYVSSMVKALRSDAGSTVRRKWDECCDRVVFQTRFWPTLADLQKVADELTHNEGPNI